MIKKWIKTGIATVMHSTGAASLIGKVSGAKDMPLILGYHRVVEDFSAYRGKSILPMLVGVRTLERQLDWIGRYYEFVSLDEAAIQIREGRKGRPVAAVTFDDGYRDVYEYAFPMLQRKGIPSAVFVVTDLVGTDDLLIHDELYLLLSKIFGAWGAARENLMQMLRELDIPFRPPGNVNCPTTDAFAATRSLLQTLSQEKVRQLIAALREQVAIADFESKEFLSMDWEMLSEMQEAGVTIGTHTRTHAVLTNETWGKVAEEAKSSKQRAEEMLGREIRHFAYPDGRFNRAVVRNIAYAGYSHAYTTCRHRDILHPDLTIPRRMLWENSCMDASGHVSPAILGCQVNGLFDLTSRCMKSHGV